MPANEPTAKVIALHCSSNPLSEQSEPEIFIPLISNAVPVDIEASLQFTLPISSADSQKMAKYGTGKLLYFLATFSAPDMIVHYSDTLSH